MRVTPTTASIAVRGLRAVAGAPAQEVDRFPAGSLTKAMTATLAGVLVQKRVIDWDSRLADVLPDAAPGARAEYAHVTLRDLLTHRSGLYPATTDAQLARLPELAGTPLQQRLQLVQWALRQPPSVPPRTRTDYSNGGFVAAAAMLERVSGRAFEQLLQEEVFAPLQASVAFGAPGSTGGPLGHADPGQKRWTPVPANDAAASVPAFSNPAGGALLRGADLAAFLQLHLRALRGQTGLLITPDTARELHRAVQDGNAMGWLEGTGLGGTPLDWHNGSDDRSYYALMAVSTRRESAAAVIVNGYASDVEAVTSAALARLIGQ